MRSEIFQGTASKVQEDLSAFLKDKNLKIHGFSQSQSTVGNNENDAAASVIVTITLLYSEYSKERRQVTGFNREAEAE